MIKTISVRRWRSRITFILPLILGLILIVVATVTLPAQARLTSSDLPRPMAVNAFPNLTFAMPVDIAHAGDSRLFTVEQAGIIRVLNGRGPAATSEVFLDIKSRVTSGGEKGLLGLVFHPEYASNGYFFVNYTSDKEGTLKTFVSRFQVTADPDRADPSSELKILEVDQPYGNHNGGDLNFGPDGYLYIGLGDGGSGGDPGNRAQNGGELLGKMLRIDIDRTAPGKNYAIPGDNPFVGEPTLDEIWAVGLRNPWRFSFDRMTGDMYIGDVGQGLWEEIDFQPASSSGGQNYGWRLKEGTHCFIPETGCDPGGLTDPIFEYSHTEGCSVTGGYVYRGSAFPALQGQYLYADYCTGEVYAFHGDGNGAWQNNRLLKIDNWVSTFGEDQNGELYIALREQGEVYILVEQKGTAYAPILGK